MPMGFPKMSNFMKGLFVILLLLLMGHVPVPLPGEAKDTRRVSVELARGDAVADPPAGSREKAPDTATGKERPQNQGEQQGRGSDPGGGESTIKEFVPSEEIAAEQAVDFPADI